MRFVCGSGNSVSKHNLLKVRELASSAVAGFSANGETPYRPIRELARALKDFCEGINYECELRDTCFV
jgi:hypothetical protein